MKIVSILSPVVIERVKNFVSLEQKLPVQIINFFVCMSRIEEFVFSELNFLLLMLKSHRLKREWIFYTDRCAHFAKILSKQ